VSEDGCGGALTTDTRVKHTTNGPKSPTDVKNTMLNPKFTLRGVDKVFVCVVTDIFITFTEHNHCTNGIHMALCKLHICTCKSYIPIGTFDKCTSGATIWMYEM
jgi:hypothetical protein